MSGSGIYWVPPSEINFAAPTANQWQRGIPGLATLFVSGVADCHNLAAMSPPTLLERFELYAYSIAWGAAVGPGEAGVPTFTVELAILINDRPVHTEQAQVLGTATAISTASGTFTADLINPIPLNARDRLGLRIGMMIDANGAGAATAAAMLGAQAGAAGSILPDESTISYNVYDMPASRRI